MLSPRRLPLLGHRFQDMITGAMVQCPREMGLAGDSRPKFALFS